MHKEVAEDVPVISIAPPLDKHRVISSPAKCERIERRENKEGNSWIESVRCYPAQCLPYLIVDGN